MTVRWWGSLIVVAVALALAGGCSGLRLAVLKPPTAAFRTATGAGLSGDDLDLDSLRRAARASLSYFRSVEENGGDMRRPYTLGFDRYSFEQFELSAANFLALVESTPPRLIRRRVAEQCRAYSPVSGARFTAYYEPVLEARRRRDRRFRYPVYRRPDELTLVRLKRFFSGDRRSLHGQIHDHELLPFLSRREIDGERGLDGRGLELAWVDDPVALYFLHIQGSGRLSLDDGGVMRVNFAASNGRAYTSVGRYMLDRGILGPGQGSSGAIRSFLGSNPDLRDELLFNNERYIFFREMKLESDQGPIGSLGVPLVAGRSLATDRRYVPPGVPLYITTDAPVVTEEGAFEGWRRFSRFAFSHDSGVAIKGSGRADVYWGEGEEAGSVAGYMNTPGSMMVLMCGVRPAKATIRASFAGGFTSVAWPSYAAAGANAGGDSGM